jgi:hypothetical protein
MGLRNRLRHGWQARVPLTMDEGVAQSSPGWEMRELADELLKKPR